VSAVERPEAKSLLDPARTSIEHVVSTLEKSQVAVQLTLSGVAQTLAAVGATISKDDALALRLAANRAATSPICRA
jgi:hypothetical protein